MDTIIKEILSWNLEGLKFQEKNIYKLENLPDFFGSTLEYQKKFEPLFFEEFRAQIIRFFEVQPSFLEEKALKVNYYQKQSGRFFFSARLEKSTQNNLRVGDLLILSKSLKHLKPSQNKFMNFGVISTKNFQEGQEFFIETNYHFWKQSVEEKGNLAKIFTRKISNLMNHIREYLALCSFCNSLPVYKRLIFPVLSLTNHLKNKRDKFLFQNHLSSHFNQSQIDGIISTFKRGITLIQGPPGTGKTRTILGIISLIIRFFKVKRGWIKKVFQKKFSKNSFLGLSKPPINLWVQNLKKINYLGRPENEIKKFKFPKKKENEKIIVCAPSNSAIDENATRTALGFPFQPLKSSKIPFQILRLGPNYSPLLDHLSLEHYALVWASEHDFNIRFRIYSKIFQKARLEIIKKSLMVYTTLACTGYSIMKQPFAKETVIIDEAAQAVELSTLIPFKKNCTNIILVGDVQQLPATVFSKFSVKFEYDRSLFKRLQLRKHPVWFLETQYRMHPQISSFPARKFYQNGLKDSQQVGNTIHFHLLRCFGPLSFFDLCESLEQNHLGQMSSWCNLDEVRLSSLLLRSLVCLHPSFKAYSIGIITGYNGQIKEFKNFQFNKNQNFEGQINTVDGFQGKEKDIVFFSCVRAKVEKGIGFLADSRRINVAFTRARFGFWIIGNSGTLESDINWREAIIDTKKRERFFCIRKPLERSSRRLVYWSVVDKNIFSSDGDFYRAISVQLLDYLSKKA